MPDAFDHGQTLDSIGQSAPSTRRIVALEKPREGLSSNLARSLLHARSKPTRPEAGRRTEDQTAAVGGWHWARTLTAVRIRVGIEGAPPRAVVVGGPAFRKPSSMRASSLTAARTAGSMRQWVTSWRLALVVPGCYFPKLVLRRRSRLPFAFLWH